jgi:hypothetical protein
MLEINFSGPYSLLPSNEEVSLLLAEPSMWSPGIYMWTFLYNQAHRVNFIGVCTQNIAVRHNDHLADYLAGRRMFYRANDLEGGTLEPAYRPENGSDHFVAEFPEMMGHLSAVRIFAAPFDGPESVLERLGAGVVAHFQQLGGRAADWLDNEPVTYCQQDYDEKLTVRFGRPAFIASMPDEMHL